MNADRQVVYVHVARGIEVHSPEGGVDEREARERDGGTRMHLDQVRPTGVRLLVPRCPPPRALTVNYTLATQCHVAGAVQENERRVTARLGTVAIAAVRRQRRQQRPAVERGRVRTKRAVNLQRQPARAHIERASKVDAAGRDKDGVTTLGRRDR
jgi:hypothetical protein